VVDVSVGWMLIWTVGWIRSIKVKNATRGVAVFGLT